MLIPSFALPGLAMNYAIGLWGPCWLLLGWSLLTEAGQTLRLSPLAQLLFQPV
jgi:hypothetical protein